MIQKKIFLSFLREHNEGQVSSTFEIAMNSNPNVKKVVLNSCKMKEISSVIVSGTWDNCESKPIQIFQICSSVKFALT